MSTTKKSYTGWTIAVYAGLIVGGVYLFGLTSRQSTFFREIEALADKPQEASQGLLQAGPAAFEFMSDALCFHRDTSVRQRAGRLLLRGLLRELAAQVQAHPEDAPDSASPKALAAAKVMAHALGNETPAAEQRGISTLMAYLDERTVGATAWQRRMRNLTDTDKVSIALKDESARVRELANAILALIGPANKIDKARLAKRRELEAALLDAESADPGRMSKGRRALSALGKFALAPMVGAIAAKGANTLTQMELAKVVSAIIANELAYNTKAEVTSLIGQRASALCVQTVLRDKGALGQVLTKVFAASPHVELKDVEALCKQAGSAHDAATAEKIVKQIAKLEGR